MVERLPLIDWGVAGRPMPGEAESGDNYIVKLTPDGVLLAVVDGLGYGPGAAEAGRVAVATLDEYAGQTLVSLVRRCHERLKGTHGAGMTLATISAADGTMTWLSVGSVEGLLVRAENGKQQYVTLRDGVVGDQLPSLRTSVWQLMPGDTLIMATDGLRHGFGDTVAAGTAPQSNAERILNEHAKSTDDALVLVVRFIGSGKQ